MAKCVIDPTCVVCQAARRLRGQNLNETDTEWLVLAGRPCQCAGAWHFPLVLHPHAPEGCVGYQQRDCHPSGVVLQ